MTRTLSLFLMLVAAALFAACGGKHDTHEHGHEDGQEMHGDEHDHDHDHDDDHEHDHAAEGHDDHDHGERVEVGTAKIGGHDVTLAVFGKIEAGHEGVLDIEVEGALTVRAWVGLSSGRGSLKAKVEGSDGDYHGHIEVPGTLPEGSEIWVELEDADGTKSQGSFKLP